MTSPPKNKSLFAFVSIALMVYGRGTAKPFCPTDFQSEFKVQFDIGLLKPLHIACIWIGNKGDIDLKTYVRTG